MDKSGLRTWAKGLPPASEAESAAVTAALVEWLGLVEPTTVLVYLSMSGEIRVEAVVPPCLERHRFATTRTPSAGPLTIHPFDAPREHHRFGYEQPQADAPRIDRSRIGIVLVPGLVFDRSGNRLGWGKGYYDRLLAGLSPGVMRVAITLERRLVERVPAEVHDIVMTHLATERGVFRLG